MVSDVILDVLKTRGYTKQWLAEKMSLSYSTLHQKLSNNTFTAEELLLLCELFNLSLEHFKQKEMDVFDLKQIPIDKRPDVIIEDISKYHNGGIHIESMHINGSLIYLPYGVGEYIYSKSNVLENVFESYLIAIEKELAQAEDAESQLIYDNLKHDIERLMTIKQNLDKGLEDLYDYE